jgi:hypothetical protein
MTAHLKKFATATSSQTDRFLRARQIHHPQGAMESETLLPATDAGAVAPIATSSSLATLLTGHVLRDGEVVLLIIKPSLWFIVFQSISIIAAVGLALLLIPHLVSERVLWSHRVAYVETALLLIAARLMWAMLHWMGRLYVLTDQRVIRLAGVFSVEVSDCPLRRIAQTQIVTSVKDRLCRIGSIEIYPKDSEGGDSVTCAGGTWQTIARPVEVHAQIQAAIRRVKNG